METAAEIARSNGVTNEEWRQLQTMLADRSRALGGLRHDLR